MEPPLHPLACQPAHPPHNQKLRQAPHQLRTPLWALRLRGTPCLWVCPLSWGANHPEGAPHNAAGCERGAGQQALCVQPAGAVARVAHAGGGRWRHTVRLAHGMPMGCQAAWRLPRRATAPWATWTTWAGSQGSHGPLEPHRPHGSHHQPWLWLASLLPGLSCSGSRRCRCRRHRGSGSRRRRLRHPPAGARHPCRPLPLFPLLPALPLLPVPGDDCLQAGRQLAAPFCCRALHLTCQRGGGGLGCLRPLLQALLLGQQALPLLLPLLVYCLHAGQAGREGGGRQAGQAGKGGWVGPEGRGGGVDPEADLGAKQIGNCRKLGHG